MNLQEMLQNRMATMTSGQIRAAINRQIGMSHLAVTQSQIDNCNASVTIYADELQNRLEGDVSHNPFV